MTTRAEEYSAMGRKLLADARVVVRAEDLVQASEKLWGAADQMVKSVAERKGWEHGGHRQLFQVTARLAQESGDPEFSALFHVANSLHWNFHENLMTTYQVEHGLERMQELIEKLEAA